MSDILNEQGSGINPLKEGKSGKKEVMLQDATLLADFLSKSCDKVKKVGIGGSLSIGKKNPGDIDLVIFVDDQVAQKLFKAALYYHLGKEELIEYLVLEGETRTLWEMTLAQISSPVDFLLVPDSPSEASTHLWAQNSLDPTFLESLTKNVKIYHPEINGFIKEQIYSPEQIEMIRKASFVRLKEINDNLQAGDDVDIDRMQSSHSHQKRIKGIVRTGA